MAKRTSGSSSRSLSGNGGKASNGKRRKLATEELDSSENPSVQQKYWLMKSEPETRLVNGVDVKFSIDDLRASPDMTSCWDGVRNYQARNLMKEMQIGDQAFFYHSNCKEPGIAGIVEISREAYVDDTQFNRKDPHFDPKSKKSDPKWFMVDVRFVRKTKRYIRLSELKEIYQEHSKRGGELKEMALFTRARLSVQPVTREEFDFILSLEEPH